jgi:hypothetical protein
VSKTALIVVGMTNAYEHPDALGSNRDELEMMERNMSVEVSPARDRD